MSEQSWAEQSIPDIGNNGAVGELSYYRHRIPGKGVDAGR